MRWFATSPPPAARQELRRWVKDELAVDPEGQTYAYKVRGEGGVPARVAYLALAEAFVDFVIIEETSILILEVETIRFEDFSGI